MKQTLLISAIIFFSLLSGGLGSVATQYFVGEFITSEISENTETKTSEKIVQNVDLISLQSQITDTVQTIAPSVVSIIIKKDLVVYRSDPWGFFQQAAGTVQRQVGGGSGFFIKNDGTIITNKHVVADSTAQYTVILNDGSEYDAKVLALDPVNDLAIIKIDATNQGETFSALPLISNNDDIKIGEFTLAVGNALAEFQNSVSLGIVSGKNRSLEAGGQNLSGLIQTDAAINPGNSGGPLIDLDGKVIGINTAIVSNSNGIGFSIALSQEKVNYMLESIAKDGRIKRPFIGINYIPNSAGVAAQLGLSSELGVYVVDESGSIIDGSAAQLAGIEPGDIILEINNIPLSNKNTLESLIQNAIPGDMLSLKVIKKSGEEKTLELKLGEY